MKRIFDDAGLRFLFSTRAPVPDILQRFRERSCRVVSVRDGKPRKMPSEKVTETAILQRYADGERDFSFSDLRLTDASGADLSDADLRGADLQGADLRGAKLRGVKLGMANLSNAKLDDANLSGAVLSGADLQNASICGADLSGAHLSRAEYRRLQGTKPSNDHLTNHLVITVPPAYLSGADLRGANLSSSRLGGAILVGADLRGANLCDADLSEANLYGADLRGAELAGAIVHNTFFACVDLSVVRGLSLVRHAGPSSLGIDTLRLSKGVLPEAFLLGCGFETWEVLLSRLYDPTLLPKDRDDLLYQAIAARAGPSLRRVFISYSWKDSAFVDQLWRLLIDQQVYCWLDRHDMTAGPIEKQVKEAQRTHPTTLLILSKDAIDSDWVEHEVEEARRLEKELGKSVLCPVSLDDGWKECKWPDRLMEQVKKNNVLSFAGWEEPGVIASQFKKLLAGIARYYARAGGRVAG